MSKKEPSLSNVLSAIKAAVISQPTGVLESNLDADFRDLMGYRIPFRELGFKSVEELILKDDSLRIQNKGGLRYVVASQSKSSHVASLIAGQKKPPGKKKRPGLHKMFLNAPRNSGSYNRMGSYSVGRGGGRGNRGGLSRTGKTSSITFVPKMSGQMPNYSRPIPKSTRTPVYSTNYAHSSTSSVPPLLPNTGRVPLSVSYRPAGAESCDSLDEFDEYQYEEEDLSTSENCPSDFNCSNQQKPSQPVPQLFPPVNKSPAEPFAKPSSPRPLLSTPHIAQPSPSTSSISNSQIIVHSHPLQNKVREITTVAIPNAPVPVPVDLNHEDTFTNGYTRQGPSKRGGKSKSQSTSSKLASVIDKSEALPGSYTAAFLNLVKSNHWSEPEFRLLPRISSNKREIYASTVRGSAVLYNSDRPVSYDFSTFPDEYVNRADSKEAVSKKALEGMMLRLEESKKIAPVSENLELMINRVISIVLPHSNGLWAFELEKLYKEKYQEQLPDGWVEEVASSDGPLIAEKLAEFSFCIRASPSIMNMNGKKMDVVALGELEYPPTETWDIYITSVVSCKEVWFRFVGPEHSAWYDRVMESMMQHYSDWASLAVLELEIGAVYVYPGPEGPARVELIRINSIEAVVRHIDHGDMEVVPKNHLCKLDDIYRDLPPQALRASLKGLEEYEDREEATAILSERIIGQVMVANGSFVDSDPPISLVLYDTAGDEAINVNDHIFNILQMDIWNPPILCEVGSISKVTITSIWKTGDIYCQVAGEGPAWLATELAALPTSEFHPASATDISSDDLYVVKHAAGYLRRVQPISSNTYNDKIDVCYIDFGDVGTVPIKELVPLDHLSSLLTKVPKQAIKLSLEGVSNGGRFVGHLMRLVPPGTPALAKVITPPSPANPFYVVQLYHRKDSGEIVSINATVEMGEEPDRVSPPIVDSPPENTLEAAATLLVNPPQLRRPGEGITDNLSRIKIIENTSKTISPARTPNYGDFFDIYVVSVSNPFNFTVIPWKFITELQNMQERLTAFYNQLPEDDSLYTLKEYWNGRPCAIKHVDGIWYRAVIERVLPIEGPTQLVLRFCDFGNMTMSSPERPRVLADEFLKLPGLGFRARLANIKPRYGDWSMEDCKRASELLLDKSLSSINRGTQMTEGTSTLLLQVYDTSSDDDLDIGELLITEGRALKI